jgi:alpha,alpha-trehalase
MPSLGFGAVIFDLDGVVTDTARVHAGAWKTLFDNYLRRRASRLREPFHPFDEAADYRRYVDGKPRYEGVRSFLASRGIGLEEGSVGDPGNRDTVCGLGNRKDRVFMAALKRDGVRVFGATVSLIGELIRLGIPRAIASSSRNCLAVLRRAGLAHLFDTRVDGVLSGELGLLGKPAPDIFLLCAERLGVPAARCVVVEDAAAGVEAGRVGGFGLVIAVGPPGERHALLSAGADVAVSDLEAVTPIEIDQWYRRKHGG